MSRLYSAEYKQKAIELVTIQRKSIAQVSLELGVSRITLYYWLNNQSSDRRTLSSGRVSMDPAQEIKRLRAQNEAMKKEVRQLRAERDDAKEENRAVKLVIEYFRTHNSQKPSPGKCSSEPVDGCKQTPHASIGHGALNLISHGAPSSDFSDEAITREQPSR